VSDLLEVGTEVGHEKPRKSRELSNLSNLAYLRPGGCVSSHLCVVTTDLANRAKRLDRSDRSDMVLIYITKKPQHTHSFDDGQLTPYS